jgi:hypothetical protein
MTSSVLYRRIRNYRTYYLPPLPTPAPSCDDLSAAAGNDPVAGDHVPDSLIEFVPAGRVSLNPVKFFPSVILLLL